MSQQGQQQGWRLGQHHRLAHRRAVGDCSVPGRRLLRERRLVTWHTGTTRTVTHPPTYPAHETLPQLILQTAACTKKDLPRPPGRYTLNELASKTRCTSGQDDADPPITRTQKTRPHRSPNNPRKCNCCFCIVAHTCTCHKHGKARSSRVPDRPARPCTIPTTHTSPATISQRRKQLHRHQLWIRLINTCAA